MNAPLDSFFAAGLFDSPWAIAVIVIVGALINWLTKRREQKQADHRATGTEPPPSNKPPAEFNFEETLRRLMGEVAPPTPPPPPVLAPPPLPRAARAEPPPVTVWREERRLPPATATAPPIVRLPPITVAQQGVTATVTAASERQAQADRRFEQLTEQGRHPATVISHGRNSRSHSGMRANSPWRNPRSARQAFVASLVFAPPKGLES